MVARVGVHDVRSAVAMLDGQWRVIVPGGRRGETELYDLANDPGESRNLASQYPDLVKTLRNKSQQWNAMLPKDYLKSGNSDDER